MKKTRKIFTLLLSSALILGSIVQPIKSTAAVKNYRLKIKTDIGTDYARLADMNDYEDFDSSTNRWSAAYPDYYSECGVWDVPHYLHFITNTLSGEHIGGGIYPGIATNTAGMQASSEWYFRISYTDLNSGSKKTVLVKTHTDINQHNEFSLSLLPLMNFINKYYTNRFLELKSINVFSCKSGMYKKKRYYTVNRSGGMQNLLSDNVIKRIA